MLRILSFGVAGRRKPQDGNAGLPRSKSDAQRGKRGEDAGLPLTQEEEGVEDLPWEASNAPADEGLPTQVTDGILPTLASADVEEKLARLRSHRVLVADVPESLYSESVVDDPALLKGLQIPKGTTLPSTAENGPVFSPEGGSEAVSPVQSPLAEEPHSPLATGMEAAAPPTPALFAPSAVYPPMQAPAAEDAMHTVEESPMDAPETAAVDYDAEAMADPAAYVDHNQLSDGMTNGVYVPEEDADMAGMADGEMPAAYTAAPEEYADEGVVDAYTEPATQEFATNHYDMPEEPAATEEYETSYAPADEHMTGVKAPTDMAHAALPDMDAAEHTVTEAEQTVADSAQPVWGAAATDAVPALPDQAAMEEAVTNMPVVQDATAAYGDAVVHVQTTVTAAAADVPAAMESAAAAAKESAAAAVRDMPAPVAAAFEEPVTALTAAAEQPSAAIHEPAAAVTTMYEHTVSAAPAAATAAVSAAAAAALGLPAGAAVAGEPAAAPADEPVAAMARAAADDSPAVPVPSEPSANSRMAGPTSFHIPNIDHDESDTEVNSPTEDVHTSADQDMGSSLMNGSSAAVSDTRAEVTVVGGQVVDAVVTATKGVAAKPEALMNDANGTIAQAVNGVNGKVADMMAPAGKQADQLITEVTQVTPFNKAALAVDTNQQESAAAIKKVRPDTPAPQKQSGLFACFSCFSA